MFPPLKRPFFLLTLFLAVSICRCLCFTATIAGSKLTFQTRSANHSNLGRYRSSPYSISHQNIHLQQQNKAKQTNSLQLSLDPNFSWDLILPTRLLALEGPIPLIPSFGLNCLLFFIFRSKLLKVLTPEGFAHALALGSFLWATLGWRGWTVCVIYLTLGSAVTKIKFEEKKKMGIEEKREGRRGPENVWGSAFTGLVCAACASQGTNILGLNSSLFVLAYITSLATKLSDTFASEVGKAYGKTTFLITTLERVPPGTEGAISLEGSAAALGGAALLPLYAYGIQLIPGLGVIIATISGFLATFAESWIGASIQEKKGFEWMTNEVVNFLNTLIGATLAILIATVLLYEVH